MIFNQVKVFYSVVIHGLAIFALLSLAQAGGNEIARNILALEGEAGVLRVDLSNTDCKSTQAGSLEE